MNAAKRFSGSDLRETHSDSEDRPLTTPGQTRDVMRIPLVAKKVDLLKTIDFLRSKSVEVVEEA
jgi:hypothetical protein